MLQEISKKVVTVDQGYSLLLEIFNGVFPGFPRLMAVDTETAICMRQSPENARMDVCIIISLDFNKEIGSSNYLAFVGNSLVMRKWCSSFCL